MLHAALTYVLGWLSSATRIRKRRIVRFDLDETVICQIWMGSDDIQTEVAEWRIFTGEWDWCYYRIRPSASSLIEALRKHKCLVEIHTRKAERSAKQFLEAAGIRELFDAVYGRDSNMTPPDCPWVLVDDLEPTHLHARNKVLQARGWDRYAREFAEPADSADLITAHYVQCNPYVPLLGSSETEDPAPLTDLLPQILRKLDAQA